MDTGLDALATELYVAVDDFVISHPELVPWRVAKVVSARGFTIAREGMEVTN